MQNDLWKREYKLHCYSLAVRKKRQWRKFSENGDLNLSCDKNEILNFGKGDSERENPFWLCFMRRTWQDHQTPGEAAHLKAALWWKDFFPSVCGQRWDPRLTVLPSASPEEAIKDNFSTLSLQACILVLVLNCSAPVRSLSLNSSVGSTFWGASSKHNFALFSSRNV